MVLETPLGPPSPESSEFIEEPVLPISVEEVSIRLLSAVESIQKALGASLTNPPVLVTFPSDGGFEPLPAGTLSIDPKRSEISGPSGFVRRFTPGPALSISPRSVLIQVDAPVKVRVEPGLGIFTASINTPLVLSGLLIDRLEFQSAYPFNLSAVFSTSPLAPLTAATAQIQHRLGGNFLSKQSPIGVQDAFVSVPIVATSGNRLLGINEFGKFEIPVVGVGLKSFRIRVNGLSTVDFRVQGINFLELADVPISIRTHPNSQNRQDVADTFVNAWTNDPDIHQPGTQEELFVSLATDEEAVLESDLHWDAVRLQARLNDAALGQGIGSIFLLTYTGVAFGIR